MLSPFPGMDPFLESQRWRDFHHAFIEEIRATLNASVVPRYVVGVEENVYLIPFPEERSAHQRPEWIVPDTFIVEGEGAAPRVSGGGTATLVAIGPIMLTLPDLIEQRQAYLTVRYRETMEVVTLIELLSSTNKGPDGHDQYLQKREKVLESPAHLVELDLLRDGTRLPTVESLPPGDYYAFVSQARLRPKVAVYAWPLPHLLPAIPIPLAGEDPDVLLNLQAAFNMVYERAAYAYSLDYRAPLQPPLNDADSAWAREVLAEAKLVGR
jgi:hypothetical protein